MNLVILGTRPEIIKLYPLINLFEKQKIPFQILHTGQHYTKSLSEIFLKDLKIPKKKMINLKVGSGTHGLQTSIMISKIEKFIIKKKKIKNVIVYGDTNSALAGSIVASKFNKINLIHLEAGLRSFDKNMPEEINRRIIDHCSDLLFCPTEISKNYLIKEGINKKKIFNVGNTIVDAIFSKIVQEKIKKKNYKKRNILLTIHREENTRNIYNLGKILKSIYKISNKFKFEVNFPAHPKTRKLLKLIKYDRKILKVVKPLNYFDFLGLLKSSVLIISDSGGVQEEACILKTPLITVRNSTERPETIQIGCNILSKIDDDRLFKDAQTLFNRKIKWRNPYGDGKSSVKILKILKNLKKKNVKIY